MFSSNRNLNECKYYNHRCTFNWLHAYTSIVKSDNSCVPYKSVGFKTISQPNEESEYHSKIEAVKFEESKMMKIPSQIGEFFENLRCLTVSRCGLEEINKSDLEDLKHLWHLDLSHNYIKVIPDDLFTYNKELVRVSFVKNKLKSVGAELFEDFIDFSEADFQGNPGINLKYDSSSKTQFNNFETFKKLFRKLCSGLYLNAEQFLSEEIIKLELEHQTEVRKHDAKEKKLKDEIQKLKVENKDQKIEITTLRQFLDFEDDIINLLKDEKLADFTFVIENEEFKVHKFIFMARSQLFREMILENPDADRLNLKDIPIDLFKQIIAFVYFNTTPEDDADFIKLFAAASKLKIEKLIDLAAEMLIEHLNADNSYECLLVCQKYHHQELKVKVFEELKKEFPQLPIEIDDDMEKIVKLMEVKRVMDEAKKAYKN